LSESGSDPLNETAVAAVSQALDAAAQQRFGGMIEKGIGADPSRGRDCRLPALLSIDRIFAYLDSFQLVAKALLFSRSDLAIARDAFRIQPEVSEFGLDGFGRHRRNLAFKRFDRPAVADFSQLCFELQQFHLGGRALGSNRDAACDLLSGGASDHFLQRLTRSFRSFVVALGLYQFLAGVLLVVEPKYVPGLDSPVCRKPLPQFFHGDFGGLADQV
jgi:hypothetical protein